MLPLVLIVEIKDSVRISKICAPLTVLAWKLTAASVLVLPSKVLLKVVSKM